MSEYVKKRTDEIFRMIYAAYGTDTWILFGIPAEHKSAVRTIIELVLEDEERKREGASN